MIPTLERQPIALVIPWFGRDLKGGAEQQAWQIATRLAARGHRIEVLTSCCRSFADDWAENHLPAGESQEAGLTIRRFRVNPRNRPAFDDLNRELLSMAQTRFLPGVPLVQPQRASIWTNENINSTDLEAYVAAHRESYKAFIFIPYLYGIVLRALPIVAQRAWLQPCLHDESYAYLPDIAAIFRAAAGLLFNSHGEMKLAARLFGPMVLSRGHVVGEGVEFNGDPVSPNRRDRQQQGDGHPYVLCLGRRSLEKGTDALVAGFARFRRQHPGSRLKLLLAGPGQSSYDRPAEGIIDLGLVDEPRKAALLSGCRALLQPSLNESFSRVLFEAWMHGKPAVVHKDCLATACAVENSKGGWVAGTEEEWVDRLSYLSSATEEELRSPGNDGKQFAKELADWDSVMARYEKLLDLSPQRGPHSVGSQKKTEALHQLLPNLSYGDAISNQAIWIREQLLMRGYRSEIFVRYIDERVRDKCRAYQPGFLKPDDGLLYHHSIGSEITPAACSHPGRKWLIYHNITPAEFFQPYRQGHARLLRQGREEMWTLARAFPKSVGVSAYNAEELELYGFSSPQVLPLAVDPGTWSVPPDETLMTQLQDGRRNLLYVGRYAPNKCQHDLVSAFAHYRRLDPDSRLILVGSGEPDDPYVRFLEQTLDKHALRAHVLLTGHVSLSQLHAYYRTAHLFWSMSEHEGFCVPLIEAMWFDLPVLAFRAGAVAETLAEAGVKFGRKENLGAVAALARRMTAERVFAEPILRAQQRRRQAFSPAPVFDALLQMVS
jgi:glycosyltransferase involved in cell wall biosynthesis